MSALADQIDLFVRWFFNVSPTTMIEPRITGRSGASVERTPSRSPQASVRPRNETA